MPQFGFFYKQFFYYQISDFFCSSCMGEEPLQRCTSIRLKVSLTCATISQEPKGDYETIMVT